MTNALALLGVFLSVTGIPVDAIGAPPTVVVVDVLTTLLFAGCWVLNASGRLNAGRVVLMTTTNLAILNGLIQVGADAEVRTMCFPLVLLPFLVFAVTEWIYLVVFISIPVLAYFTANLLHIPHPGLAHQVNLVYAPILSFVMIVTGTYVFAAINRSAETRLLHARAHAANTARLAALGEMSGGIAHEVRNPLAAIHLAATQIVEHPEQSAQAAQLAERIRNIVMRATKIIEMVRAFSRDASHDPFVSVPVQRIVADTLELCGKRIAEHGIALTVGTLPADLVLECRAVQLSQVLMNLIANAYDAVETATERWVRIDARSDGTHVEIAVTDSGAGVTASTRARMFEPFFTTKPVERGTGLGLSLSRGLVEAHHGTLELDVSLQNTRFVMRLPATQPA